MTCTASRLREHTAAVAIRLLPNGHREGQLWRAGSTAGDSGQSLAVYCSGPKRGKWDDWSTGERGDLLDLIEASPNGCGGDRLRALRWAHDFLRAPAWAPTSASAARFAREPTEEDKGSWRDRWREAKPLVPGDLVWRYLAGRGIDLARLPAIPTLRFHHGLWHKCGRRFPAMVAAIVGPDGARLSAIHRTWLTVKDGAVVKIPIKPSKMSLGPVWGGCIPLTQGPSGRLWRDPAPGEVVGISEGLENGLTMATRGTMGKSWRILCGVSLSFLPSTVLPSAIAEVVLILDNDPPDPKRDALVMRAQKHFQELGKKVSTVRVKDRAIKDVNELVQHLTARPA
jgi:hypothetical protein